MVLKAVHADLLHKTEAGALRLDLHDRDAVWGAAEALLGLADTLLVEAMVTDAVAELIVGVHRDPTFGLCLIIGSGGILVELVGDSRLMLMPATRNEVAEALGSLRVAALFRGFRGRPAGDMDAAVAAVLAIQAFALSRAETLAELDVNPLMIRPAGRGALAADVLIRIAETAS